MEIFEKTPFASKEEIERYVPCKDGMVLITKSHEDSFEDEDDFVVGDSIYLFVHPDGRVELTTPADVDFCNGDIRYIS